MDKALTIKEKYEEHMKLQMGFLVGRKVMQQKREESDRKRVETYNLMKQVLIDKTRYAAEP